MALVRITSNDKLKRIIRTTSGFKSMMCSRSLFCFRFWYPNLGNIHRHKSH